MSDDALNDRYDSLRSLLNVVEATKASVSQAVDGEQHKLTAIMRVARDVHVASEQLRLECGDKLHEISQTKAGQ